MNKRKATIFLLQVAALFLLFFNNNLQAQSLTAKYVSTTGNSNGYYEYLPQGYANSSQTFPLIIFVEGIGELGDGSTGQLPKLLANGPLFYINAGQFPSSFTVNGKTSSFIIITPQYKAWPGAGDVDAVITYAIQHYKVDVSRIYLTGISMGGGVVWDYAGNNINYANRIAALLPFCGASGASTTKARNIAAANLPVWAFHNQYDPEVPASYTQNWISQINQAPAPNPLARQTIFNVGGHDAWSPAYYGSYQENGLNIYQWMLQYSRSGTPPPQVNQPPTATAGSAQTITLPTNTVTLSGKGTDADGSIAAYKWSYVSGPSQYLINTPAQYQTTISNLTQGTYVFRVTVTDNLGATGSADVTITVNGGSVPAPTPTPIPSLYTLLPAKIEAEKWSAMSGVQTETTTDAGGGLDVDYIDPADWMDYAVNAPAAGSYTIQLRLASPAANAQLQIKKSDGTVLATVKVPNTGGYQTWQTVSATVTLPLGQQTLRIVSTSPQWNPWNINWLNIVSVTVVTPVPVSTTFRVEAENWSAMSGVQTETTTDVGGGKDVDYIDPNDWMDYAVNAPSAGSYNIQFRVASPAANAQLQLKKSDGTVLATVKVPNTGGWETWQTGSATVTLPAGQQTLRIVSTSPQWNSWNINYMDFTTTTALTSISAATAADGSSFSVSPNPVVDKFILQVNNSLTGNMDVQILDGAGAVKKQFTVLKSAAGSTQTYLSISDLAAGSYTIQVTMTGWKATQPLVKQ